MSALRGFLQGVAQTGSLAGGLGGAISGGVSGAIHPQWRAELERIAQIHKQQGKVDQALKIEKELTQLDALDARTEAARQKNSPDKTRAQMFRELTQRIRIGGGHLNPADPEQARLMRDLNITAARGGGGFNAQRVKVIRGADGQDRLVYLDFKDGEIAPRYLDVEGNAGAPLSERDRKLLAIELERENRERALDGLPPLKFDDDAPSTYTGPKPPSENTQTQQTAPTSTTSQPPAQSTSPVLVPSGAQPEKVNPVFGNRRHAGGYRGNRASRGGSRRDEIGASLEARDAARYQQEAVNARAQAAAARSRGEDDVAASWEAAARTADENARKVGNRRGGRQSTPQPKKNDPLGILD